MKGFIALTKRNLLIYFKDFQAVFFSLLSSLIVLGLYLLFLKGTFVDAINSSMTGLEAFVSSADVETLANMILLVGIIGSAVITVSYSCLSTIVSDREKKIDFDICATPIKRWQIIVSYFLAATISAFIIASLILLVGLAVMPINGNFYVSPLYILYAFLATLLGSVSATALFMNVVLFFKTIQASGAFSGILSAGAGFIIGAYIPISQFDEKIQTFCNLFPGSQVTIIYRNIMMNGILDKISEDLKGIDGGMFSESIKECFTFNAKLFGNTFSINEMIIYTVILTLVFIVSMIFVFSKTYKRK